MENINLKYNLDTFDLSMKINDQEWPKNFLITDIDIHIDSRSIPTVKLTMEASSIDVDSKGNIIVDGMTIVEQIPDAIRKKLIEILSSRKKA